MQLTYTGEDFEYHFGRPLTLSRCKWKVKETNKRFIWHFKAQNRTSVVRISGSCSKEQMMPLLYESPDGKVSDIPLWEGGNATGTIELLLWFIPMQLRLPLPAPPMLFRNSPGSPFANSLWWKN